MKPETTTINHDIGRIVIGYMINADFGSESQKKIAEIQSSLTQAFGDAIWNSPADALHITLMDWIAPLVDYGEDKKAKFDNIFPEYDGVMTEILEEIKPIKVNLREIRAFQGAITIIGQDNGEFGLIRSNFLEKTDLMSGTKQPPKIIHSTISRYNKEIELGPIVEFASNYSTDITLSINSFRLVKEKVIPQLDYEVVKEYLLRE